MFLARSSVHVDPAMQHAPPSAFANVEQELWFTGQFPSRFRSSFSGRGTSVSLEMRRESSRRGL